MLKIGILPMVRIFTTLLYLLMVTGCAVMPKLPKYTPPGEYTGNQNTKVIIDKDFDAVWAALIESVSERFFTIKNYEKASGLMTLAFGEGNAAKYVDCGYIETANLKAKGPYIEFVQSKLFGHVNLVIKAISAKKTQVSAIILYNLNIVDLNLTQNWSFGTGGSQTKHIGVIDMTCVPTYEAEKSILAAIQEAAKN